MATGQQRVVATFGDRRGAESAAAALKHEGFEPRLDAHDDESFALQGQMQEEYKQVGPGRPGPDTEYRRIEHWSYKIIFEEDTEALKAREAETGAVRAAI